MKFLFTIVLLFSVSCTLFHETVRYQKFPLPHGKLILLVPTVSSFYSDHYLWEKEVILQISESLERSGYSVFHRDEIHEFKNDPIENNHLSEFQKQILPKNGDNSSRFSYWSQVAHGLGIPFVLFVRFPYQVGSPNQSIRIFLYDLNEKQIEQFDWVWKPDSELPLFPRAEGNP
ncbi:hypothetical protein EHR04_15775 [Leptospira levettii]|uniref:hypothetical protein n=1 Tax=Leptospira levettii TaxID=2023178 RepID=UPI000C2B29ED|nr:hypothetical protein [Leptospira levettii]PKA25174.1 hypothetical protein CH381_17105 [Leptospira sp. mixed culture ATI2-C-A1]TGM39551.1 hypothetical protein EHQ75_09250 [Leptospira levettii]TGM76942.1 hypothetical protein EHR04_15775 [Leptospira levettii]